MKSSRKLWVKMNVENGMDERKNGRVVNAPAINEGTRFVILRLVRRNAYDGQARPSSTAFLNLFNAYKPLRLALKMLQCSSIGTKTAVVELDSDLLDVGTSVAGSFLLSRAEVACLFLSRFRKLSRMQYPYRDCRHDHRKTDESDSDKALPVVGCLNLLPHKKR